MIESHITKIILIGLMIVLLAGMMWWAKKFGAGMAFKRDPNSAVQIVATQPIDFKTRLIAIRWQGRDHLLLVSERYGFTVTTKPADAATESPLPLAGEG